VVLLHALADAGCVLRTDAAVWSQALGSAQPPAASLEGSKLSTRIKTELSSLPPESFARQ